MTSIVARALSVVALMVVVPPQTNAPLPETTDIVRQALPAIVTIQGETINGEKVSGSGFIVDSNGTIITNVHVIAEMKSGGVRLQTGDIYDSFQIKAFDSRKDLAVIQVAGFKLPTLRLADSSDVKIGESVILIGNPLGLTGSVSAGVVSGLRQLDGSQVIQTDAAANPGNSGGPLLRKDGSVVGVLSFKLRGAENLNFVIPANYAQGLLNSANERLSLAEFRQRLGASQDAFRVSEEFPSKWKSLNTGTSRAIRKDADYLYIEAQLNDASKRAGAFTIGELKRNGESYVGQYRMRLACEWNGQLKTCPFTESLELTKVTPTRIEGWVNAHDFKALNCRRCEISAQEKRTEFVWIPE
jgi:hypothetical protein